MPYVPPHKRHSRDADTPAPSPESLAHQFGHIGPSRGRRDRRPQGGFTIFYPPGSLALWWPIGSPAGDADPIPASFRLDPVPCEPVEGRTGAKAFVLVGGGEEGNEGGGAGERPWEAIVERIEAPLLASVHRAKEETAAEGVDVRLAFIASLGKVRFHRNSCLETIKKAAATAESDSRNKVHKTFYPNLPKAYMEEIEHIVVPKIGLGFESEKENYHVKVFDKSQPDVTISCMCMVTGDGRALNLHKIKMNHSRHLVIDFSCLYKDLDFRLMLVNKRRIVAPNDEEKADIDKLIRSAILDPDVKGGLRWPLGKDSVAERYNLVNVAHIKSKAFRGPAVRLKLRHTDRFDHEPSTGEVSDEVSLKLTGISNKLRDGNLETEPLMEMVGDAVKLIRDHFLSYTNHQSP